MDKLHPLEIAPAFENWLATEGMDEINRSGLRDSERRTKEDPFKPYNPRWEFYIVVDDAMLDTFFDDDRRFPQGTCNLYYICCHEFVPKWLEEYQEIKEIQARGETLNCTEVDTESHRN